MEKKNRWGIPNITTIAQEKVFELAPSALATEELESFIKQAPIAGFVAHNYPGKDWAGKVGFEPDPVFYSEVIVGLAGEAASGATILAKVLICREKSVNYYHIEWGRKT